MNYRRLRLKPALAAGLCAICLSVYALSDATTITDEWRSLFNGTDLSGWTIQCQPQDRGKTFWQVDDDTILADSLENNEHDYVWLMSNREYSDFVLRLKFQAYRESPGNSGIQIRSRYDTTDKNGWLNGPQIDINPPGPWRTGMMWDETRGNQRWIFPNLPDGQWVKESMADPKLIFHYSNDEIPWNDFEITAIGLKVKAVLNGITVTDFNGEGTLNDEIHEQREVGLKGHIALQIHTGDRLKIRFKDIYIKDLSN